MQLRRFTSRHLALILFLGSLPYLINTLWWGEPVFTFPHNEKFGKVISDLSLAMLSAIPFWLVIEVYQAHRKKRSIAEYQSDHIVGIELDFVRMLDRIRRAGPKGRMRKFEGRNFLSITTLLGVEEDVKNLTFETGQSFVSAQAEVISAARYFVDDVKHHNSIIEPHLSSFSSDYVREYRILQDSIARTEREIEETTENGWGGVWVVVLPNLYHLHAQLLVVHGWYRKDSGLPSEIR